MSVWDLAEKKPHSENSLTVGCVEVSFCWPIGNVLMRSLEKRRRVRKSRKPEKKLTSMLNIQHALEMIGVVSGMDNEQKSVCVRLKQKIITTISFIETHSKDSRPLSSF